MALRELGPGQKHPFPSTPLVVEVTGTASARVTLLAVDQAGDEAASKRISPRSVLLLPNPRRLRLVVRPLESTRFPAGTTVGLSLRTEGAAASVVELVVVPVDVAALPERELAVLEFTTGQGILSVPKARESLIDGPDVESVVGGLMDKTRPSGTTSSTATSPAAVRVPLPEDEGHAWLAPGRYAVREAAQLGAAHVPAAPPRAWSIVLNGSISMRAVHESGQLDNLVGLVCGILAEWTGQWASSAVVAASRVAPVEAKSTQPRALTTAAFVADSAPSSWSAVGDAVEGALQRVGADSGVVIVTDGAPGDLDRLTAVVAARPEAYVAVVVLAVSVRHGLASDHETDWWREELAAFDDLAALPRVRVAALRRTAAGLIELGGNRGAELASRLTGEPAAVRA